MKKAMYLLLVFVMCLFMTACASGSQNSSNGTQNNNNSTQNNNNSTQSGDQQFIYDISDEMSAEEKYSIISHECDAFVEMKINPEFELYIAWDDSINEMRVLGVRPTNEDAETLFQSLSVTNMTLYDALYSIFDTAKESGLLKSESEIEIAYYGRFDNNNAKEVIPLILDGYRQEKSISFRYHLSFTEAGDSNPTIDTDEFTEAGDSNSTVDTDDFDEVEYDADGNVVKTVRNIDDHTVETCTYHKDGSLLLRITEYKNDETVVEEYFDQGVLVKKIINTPWEVRTESFDTDGQMISVIIDNSEDTFHCEEYYTDGVLVKSYYRDEESERTEVFDSEGNKISHITNGFKDGQRSKEHFENGVLIKSYSCNEELEQTITFDISGNMTSRVINHKKDGSHSESYWTYYVDGSLESYKNTFSGAEHGGYEEKQYYQSGKVSMDYKVYLYGDTKGDNKYFYDENGNPTRYEGKNNFGERVEIVYNSDGSHVDRIYESSGKVRVDTWGADGSLTVTYE